MVTRTPSASGQARKKRFPFSYMMHDGLPWLALVGIIALAAGLRLYRLGSLPGGLHFDEAAYGMLALDVLAGKHTVFFSAYAGREAGYPYLVALAIHLFGQTMLAIRLPAALAGVLLVLAIFLVGRRALGMGGALLAAGAAASVPWLLHLNRIGFRANLLPTLLTLWVWLLLRALQTNRWRDWFAAGVLLGLTAHTYLAARFVPILLLLFLAYLARWHRETLRHALPGIGGMVTVAALIVLPLLLHFLRVPADWSERTGQLWACSGLEPGQCLTRIAAHTWETLGMVGVRGDPLRVFNLPGSPALPASVGWLFYVGLFLALRRWREPALALLLLWWLTMTLPGILTHDAVSYVRTSGAAAPTLLLWALPLVTLSRMLPRGVPQMQRLRVAAGVGLLVLMAVVSSYDYFQVWAKLPELYYDYMGYATDAARTAAATPPGTAVYISEEYYRHPTYLYLAPTTTTAHWFDARDGWPLVPADQPYLLLLSATTPPAPQVQPLLAATEQQTGQDQRGQYGYTRLEPEMDHPPQLTPAVRLHDTVGPLTLAGATLQQEENRLLVTLFWRVTTPLPRDLRVFVHLLTPTEAKVTQDDGLGYPAREWQTGDRFVTFHTLDLPADPAPAQLQLAIGLYDLVTGERFATTGPDARAQDLLLQLDDGPLVMALEADSAPTGLR